MSPHYVGFRMETASFANAKNGAVPGCSQGQKKDHWMEIKSKQLWAKIGETSYSSCSPGRTASLRKW